MLYPELYPVCCTQSPYGSPLLTHPSTGGAQTQFCLSLCGVSESWCAQGLFEPCECLWWEWGLILNANLPLLPSCWGFSFAVGRGVSLLKVTPVPTILLGLLWPWTWAISSKPFQRRAATAPVPRREVHGLYSPWGCKQLDTTKQLSHILMCVNVMYVCMC